MHEYIKQCESNLKRFEEREEYEVCRDLTYLINALKRRDVKEYLWITFPIKQLRKAKHFPPRATWQEMEQCIKNRLGLDDIFDYSLKSEIGCPFDNYLRFGRWDIYPGVWLNEVTPRQ